MVSGQRTYRPHRHEGRSQRAGRPKRESQITPARLAESQPPDIRVYELRVELVGRCVAEATIRGRGNIPVPQRQWPVRSG